MHNRGDIVECVEDAGCREQITKGNTYVVCDTSRTHSGWDYIQILANDNRGHHFAAGMFRPIYRG
jgi:hypothetical protein